MTSVELQSSLLNEEGFETKFQQQPAEQYRSVKIGPNNFKAISFQAPANLVRNQKYSVATFIPKVLYEQFKYFFNLFYLLTALSQFVPILKVGLMFSFVAPLVLVLTLTMAKQAVEDYQRYLKDMEINLAPYRKLQCLRSSIPLQIVLSQDIQVGDILILTNGDIVPADCLILYQEKGGSVFIKTDQLDGETDWKLRKPVYVANTYQTAMISNCQISYCEPNNQIYSFQGTCKESESVPMGIGIENTAWRGVKIASGRCWAVVLFTGAETKLSLNMREARSKFGQLDAELNFYSKLLFLLMVFLSTLLVLMHGSFADDPTEFIVTYFKYFLLLSSIIPISMRVNLDFAKLFYKRLIDSDKEMKQAQCRNSGVVEELGRVEYILTDKTGTLTQNQMHFKKLWINDGLKIDEDDTQQIRDLINADKGVPLTVRQASIMTAMEALVLCHNVTPVLEENGQRTLQGSSPDELALVNYSESQGLYLAARFETKMSLSVLGGSEDPKDYEILHIFPFTSQSKCMAILLRYPNGKLVYLLKGADSVTIPKIGSSIESAFVKESCLDMASIGLRTLVFTRRCIEQHVYQQWLDAYYEASIAMRNRQQKIMETRAILETNMQLVAVTGVEDRLQEAVASTIGAFRAIGIKVWILTGDKIETAICIGRAIKLIVQNQPLHIIEGCTSQFLLRRELQNIPQGGVLVIDGASLKMALSMLEAQFFQVARSKGAVICSRVSPTQKAEIAALVIKFKEGDGRVLGVGDGGNDVALIQTAHIGVGIYGKEGIQAALASDFSIGEFQDLNALLYWHGRNSYRRSAMLSQFIIHRGLIITLMQALFISEFYYIPLPIYSGVLMLGYTTVYTLLPVFSLIFDEDISKSVALKYPILYSAHIDSQPLSGYTFASWILLSGYQALIILGSCSLLLLANNVTMIVSLSFTCLIVIEFLNVFTQITRLKYPQLVSSVASALIYILTAVLFPDMLDLKEMLTAEYMVRCAWIVGLAWGPMFATRYLLRWVNPSQTQKLMEIY